MEQKELTLEELLKLVSTNKATAMQKLKFSQMLAQSAQEEAKQEKEAKVQEIDNFIVKSGLTVQEYLSLKKPATVQEIIWQWTDETGSVHTKMKGQKGKWSSKDTVKKNLTKEKALEYAKSNDGKAFVEKLYSEA